VAEPPPAQDRLQPALLDRLKDDEPGRLRESDDARVLSKRRIRESVLRDLAWLFNATQLESVNPLAKAPHVRRSVLNFGLPAMSGQTGSSFDVTDLRRAIREAILNFEPRILPSTLEINQLEKDGEFLNATHNVIGVEIHGHLWAQPEPIEFLARTDFDLESGKVRITDLNSSQGSG
jgi:type VI secretion system protein ImpF